LVVARIDRLARSLAHLLEVVETLQARGAYFKSLADPIDTPGPSGVLVLQMLGAVAEFERALIRERTVVGVKAARARGSIGGNPGLRAEDPVVLAKLAASRRATRLARLTAEMEIWMPVIRRLRPQTMGTLVWQLNDCNYGCYNESKPVSICKAVTPERICDNAPTAQAGAIWERSSSSPDSGRTHLPTGYPRFAGRFPSD